ncbi:MAG: DUF177 domain-containing protein [Saprospiraceae bacterium]|nr:DUF177 domain-containing protein [Saprospiraceae bacterium]
MNPFKEFSLPIKGLKNGYHAFNFQIDKTFFDCFEGSPIQDGTFDVQVEMDKRDSFFELTFDFDGTMRTECDRCTASIELPFGDTQHLVVKMSEETHDEDADVVFIHSDAFEFNVAQYIYEFICLAEPFNKVYDCENDEPRPCDFDILDKISPSVSPDAEGNSEDSVKNPFQDLKNLFNKN